MPSYTGTEIANEARGVYLNSSAFTDASLLPIINMVFRQIQDKLITNGSTKFVGYFSPITVTAGDTDIPEGGAAGELPTNFHSPISLQERAVGATSYTPMKEKLVLPDLTQQPELLYWQWADDRIKLIGATSDREVRIYGNKFLPELSAIGDSIALGFTKGYIAARVASIAAASIGQNQTKADSIRVVADELEHTVLSTIARKNQSLPVRHLPYSRRMYRR